MMGTKQRAAALVLGLLLGGAAQVSAQVFTPTFMSPQRSNDLGVYLSDGPGSFSVEGIWRRGFGTYDLGFRGGLADRGGVVLLLGGELRTPLQIDDVPLLLALTGGVQGAIGDGGAAGFQGGITIGYPLDEGNFVFVPYLHPRLALVNRFGRDGLELDPLADLGFDFVLPQNIAFRFGIALGGPGANWGMGFAWR
jgi:hypothetical protein